MPALKYIIQHATATELRLLRGKTIECISLIGLAVGGDKFMNDAGEVMELLLKSQKGNGEEELADDDPQVYRLLDSSGRPKKHGNNVMLIQCTYLHYSI